MDEGFATDGVAGWSQAAQIAGEAAVPVGPPGAGASPLCAPSQQVLKSTRLLGGQRTIRGAEALKAFAAEPSTHEARGEGGPTPTVISGCSD